MKLTLTYTEVDDDESHDSIDYCLDVSFEFTDDEVALIHKHGWSDMAMCSKAIYDTQGSPQDMELRAYTYGGPVRHIFTEYGEIVQAGHEIVESARTLKANLDTAAHLFAAGPQEIPL